MQLSWLLLLVFVSSSSQSASEAKWVKYEEKGSRVAAWVERDDESPRVIRLFSEGVIGEVIAWMIWPVPEDNGGEILSCSEVTYLGLQNGALEIKLRDYSSSLLRTTPTHRPILEELSALRKGKSWKGFADALVRGCLSGEKRDTTENVLHVPLKRPVTRMALAPIRTVGVLSITPFDDGSAKVDFVADH
jgi:hypothetical protein